MRAINQTGPAILGGLPALPPLTPAEAAPSPDRLLVDTRDPLAFSHAHVPDSISIGLSASFGTWVGWLLPHDVPLAFLTDAPEADAEIARQLVRIGYENLAGKLDGGLECWTRSGRPTRSTPVLPAATFGERLKSNGLAVLDVRHASEWRAGHIPGSVNIPLPELEARAPKLLAHHTPVAVHCAASYRSGMAVSLLERLDYPDLYHVQGGFDGWRSAGFEVARSLN
jgi:hydroxyacylglutathione hydrolase